MNYLFSPPSLDDLIRLLKAWRFWVLGALTGALLGAATFYIAPPPYRARATVNVDFNLEEAWPDETDRQQFYYLEREARKLEEIAWSDAEVISCLYYPSFDVKDLTGDSVPEIILRGMAGARGNWAGSILMYRNDRIEAVNPTETINGRVCSSLTGYWTYKDLDGDGVLDIQGQETEAKGLGRYFRSDQDRQSPVQPGSQSDHAQPA